MQPPKINEVAWQLMAPSIPSPFHRAFIFFNNFANVPR